MLDSFITISEKAATFMNQNPLQNKKFSLRAIENPLCPISIDLNSNPDNYIVYINLSKLDIGDIDICILHEYVHCLQIERGFPSLNYNGQEIIYQTISNTICSAILDINVKFVLNHNGFFESKHILERQCKLMDGRYDVLKSNNNFYNEFARLDNQIIDAMMLTTFKVNSISNYNQIKHKVKLLIPGIVLKTEYTNKQLQRFDYNTADGCYHIFHNLLKEFKLKEFVQVQHNF